MLQRVGSRPKSRLQISIPLLDAVQESNFTAQMLAGTCFFNRSDVQLNSFNLGLYRSNLFSK